MTIPNSLASVGVFARGGGWLVAFLQRDRPPVPVAGLTLVRGGTAFALRPPRGIRFVLVREANPEPVLKVRRDPVVKCVFRVPQDLLPAADP